eukprot:TRINITY_DN23062_c0_g1_i2.p1 TRINITY_DN23062_c0_g1~~TRINITY_DN23062_c0_g1_i2.p1  ORF type:complete len:134 (+),score=9.02 TRINITY_DN23062_c0_g1_i2:76-477(+)
MGPPLQEGGSLKPPTREGVSFITEEIIALGADGEHDVHYALPSRQRPPLRSASRGGRERAAREDRLVGGRGQSHGGRFAHHCLAQSTTCARTPRLLLRRWVSSRFGSSISCCSDEATILEALRATLAEQGDLS